MATAYSYRFGEFLIATARRELWRAGTLVQLSPRAFDCLVYLIEHRERAVDKDELVAAIWRRNNVSDTQLGQTVLRARRAVGDDGRDQHIIRTVARFGYRWIAATDVVPDADIAVEEQPVPADAAPSPVDELRPTQNHRKLLLIAASVLIGVVSTFAFLARVHAPLVTAGEPHDAAVLLPLSVQASTGNAWLRLGAMDLIAERLRNAGLSVPPSESIVALLQSLQGSDGDIVSALRRATSADRVIRGSATQNPRGWTVQLTASGRDGTVLTVESADPDPLRAANAAADLLLGRLGRAPATNGATNPLVQDRLQRAQAALLANDLESARAILTSDPALERAEPELDFRLTQVDFRAGRYADAERTLTDLLNTPAAAQPLFRARLLNGRGAVRIRRDDFANAQQDFTAAIALMKSGDHPQELGRALMGSGVAHAVQHDFAAALAELGQAHVQLEKAGDALGAARVDSNLGGLELDRERAEQALGYLRSAAQQFESYGAINELFETLTSLFTANMTLLQPQDALAASDRSWVLRDRATDPNQRLNLELDRVDVFIAIGRFHDAAALLQNLPAEAPQANPFLARRLVLLHARLALEQGDPKNALALAARAFPMPLPADDRGEGQAEIALVHQRALIAALRIDAALPNAPRLAPASFGYPVQLLQEAEWAEFRNDAARAGDFYRRALDMAEKRGEPADIAAVTQSFGAWLIARGELDEAAAVIGRVSPWAAREFGCALLQVKLYHALRQNGAWRGALERAQALAGDRKIATELLRPRDE
jgi:DNA-binding winged helix-turn-helix (wHTH) protein/tetratricopeptide (TPR) repeat protein